MKLKSSRQQVMLLPECVDDYIAEDSDVRALDLFVDSLDLARCCFKVAGMKRGRPIEYSNKTLLKLFIYGYLNKVRSSRKLERETRLNLEVIWLIEQAKPDHWTINEFRKQNSDAFKKVLRQFHKVCGHKGCNGELNLMGLCFNWKRVLKLVGVEKLMEAILACFLAAISRLYKAIRDVSTKGGENPAVNCKTYQKSFFGSLLLVVN